MIFPGVALGEQVKKKVKPPYSNVDNLFSAATSGWLIARAEDKVRGGDYTVVAAQSTPWIFLATL